MKTITYVKKGFKDRYFLNFVSEKNVLDLFVKKSKENQFPKRDVADFAKNPKSNRQFFVWLLTNVLTGLLLYVMLLLVIF